MAKHAQKKQKREHKDSRPSDAVDTSKPTAVFTPTKGRPYTLSIAIPGSIIANAQTHDLKTQLCGTIARAAAVFSVDEIVIFSDSATPLPPPNAADAASGYAGYADPAAFLRHVLSYLETPPYLRRALFPMHPNLRTAGALPSLDMPHHLKPGESCQFREGVTVSGAEPGAGTKVDCGLGLDVRISDDVPPQNRVTLRLPDLQNHSGHSVVTAEAVAPDVPREEAGYFWGYAVRMASSLSAVFTEAEFEGGYDLSIGTSERGQPVDQTVKESAEGAQQWKHLLLVFGGVAGLEVALQADKDLLGTGVTEVKDLFDRWVNLVPGQGSRTIRTEEAVWLGLMGLRPLMEQRGDHS